MFLVLLLPSVVPTCGDRPPSVRPPPSGDRPLICSPLIVSAFAGRIPDRRQLPGVDEDILHARGPRIPGSSGHLERRQHHKVC